MNQIKAIETSYMGYRFRSRLDSAVRAAKAARFEHDGYRRGL